MWISRMERKDTSWVSEPFEKGGGPEKGSLAQQMFMVQK